MRRVLFRREELGFKLGWGKISVGGFDWEIFYYEVRRVEFEVGDLWGMSRRVLG